MTREFRELSDRRPGLPPPQFSLLMLLVLITAIAVILVLRVRSGPVAAFVAVLAALSIFAHMAGTAIGGRLRSGRRRAVIESVSDDDTAETHRMRQPLRAQESDFARTTQLSHKTALERKPILISIGLAAGLFAVLGGTILSIVMWNDFSIVNVLFGSFSSAVLGGFFGFWLSSFFQVLRNAVDEAQEDA